MTNYEMLARKTQDFTFSANWNLYSDILCPFSLKKKKEISSKNNGAKMALLRDLASAIQLLELTYLLSRLSRPKLRPQFDVLGAESRRVNPNFC